jgi:hypothetical protein
MGELFIVSVVVSGSQRDELAAVLERVETASGKGKVKWMKSSRTITPHRPSRALFIFLS